MVGALGSCTFVVVSLAGCTGEPFSRIAIRQEAGQIIVSYRNCGEVVTSVSLVEGSKTVWEIDSKDGSAQAEYVVGAQPPGFKTRVQLTARPSPTAHLQADLTTKQRNAGGVDFTLDELKPGVVVWDRGTEPAASYSARTDGSLGC